MEESCDEGGEVHLTWRRAASKSYLERETGLAEGPPQEETRDPLLGNIRFRHSYLAKPNFQRRFYQSHDLPIRRQKGRLRTETVAETAQSGAIPGIWFRPC